MADASLLGQRSVSILARFNDYDEVQQWVVVLLYVQAGCAMVGSLGFEYSGIHSTNLVLALFALVAIESGSQRLGRSYVGFLGLMILLDVVWLAILGPELWNVDMEELGWRKGWSLRVTLVMEALGFLVRLGSVVLWVKMYQLGVSEADNGYHPVDFDSRIEGVPVDDGALAFLGNNGESGGSVYNPSTFSALYQSPYQSYFAPPEMQSTEAQSEAVL